MRRSAATATTPRARAFVQYYGSREVDASLLLLPIVGFLPADDPRVRGTLAAIRRDLVVDGLVARYRNLPEVDALPPGEGLFLPCSFWLADHLSLAGRHAEAERLFKRLLDLRNDVGLLAEEYDPRARRQLGNFPQALTHVALVVTARNLSRRGGPSEHHSRGMRDAPPGRDGRPALVRRPMPRPQQAASAHRRQAEPALKAAPRAATAATTRAVAGFRASRARLRRGRGYDCGWSFALRANADGIEPDMSRHLKPAHSGRAPARPATDPHTLNTALRAWASRHRRGVRPGVHARRGRLPDAGQPGLRRARRRAPGDLLGRPFREVMPEVARPAGLDGHRGAMHERRRRAAARKRRIVQLPHAAVAGRLAAA